MSAKAPYQYQEEWGFADETHEAVLNELGGYYGCDLVELDEVFRELSVDDYEGPMVEPQDYMAALTSLDGREWHDRVVDALVQFHQATFHDSEFDLMLAETDYLYTEANTDYPDGEVVRDMVVSDPVEIQKSDIDFARVSFRPEEVFIEAWEVKGNPEEFEASQQLQGHKEAAREVSQNTDLDVTVRGKELSPEGLVMKMESTDDEYVLPRRYWGSTAVSEGSENVLSSKKFEDLQEHFFGGEINVEEAIKQVETQKEFFE